jgi:hypothetical protein
MIRSETRVFELRKHCCAAREVTIQVGRRSSLHKSHRSTPTVVDERIAVLKDRCAVRLIDT